MELGLHIANFTWNGGAPELGPTLGRVARNAEAAGIARLTVMDHLWQIGGIGPPEDEMLEAYTALGYLAGVTERVRLHVLVTAVVYREPGLLAKMVTTLDVLSGGRGGLGIGAAWNEAEARGLGLQFPSTRERFERLEETVRICEQMWSDDDGAVRGRALPARAHAQLAAEHQPAAALPDDRRLRRAEDASPRRPARRRLQHLRHARGRAQARRAARPLRARGARLRRDREDDDPLGRPEATRDDVLARPAPRARDRLHGRLHLQREPGAARHRRGAPSVVPEIAGW